MPATLPCHLNCAPLRAHQLFIVASYMGFSHPTVAIWYLLNGSGEASRNRERESALSRVKSHRGNPRILRTVFRALRTPYR